MVKKSLRRSVIQPFIYDPTKAKSNRRRSWQAWEFQCHSLVGNGCATVLTLIFNSKLRLNFANQQKTFCLIFLNLFNSVQEMKFLSWTNFRWWSRDSQNQPKTAFCDQSQNFRWLCGSLAIDSGLKKLLFTCIYNYLPSNIWKSCSFEVEIWNAPFAFYLRCKIEFLL